MDILFVNANSSEVSYQKLASSFSAIETPIWAGMLAKHAQIRGYSTSILDCEAERLDVEQSAKLCIDSRARIICFVVYGQNPNDGTPRMEGSIATSKLIKQMGTEQKILFVGPHVAALPRQTLAIEDSIDFICQNEGVYTISNLLQLTNLNDEKQLSKIKGLGFRTKEFDKHKISDFSETNIFQNKYGIILNEPEQIVPRSLLEKDLLGIAWELLPSPNKYRTSFWHSWSNNTETSPFASIYTSLGCPHKCSFCMINIINRNNNSPDIASSDSNIFRYWQPSFMITQLDRLAEMGVTNVKIADELFVLNPNHFLELCKLIKQRGHKFNFWAYSRVDTCKPQYLEALKDAGVNWLALGIENPNQSLRREFVKGGFEEVRVVDLIKDIRNAGINIIGNYIFGLPPDTHESMQETLNFALNNLTEAFNIYPAQALPGSPLYLHAIKNQYKLPDRYAGYSMLSYYTQNIPNSNLTAAEIIKARDNAWKVYHQNSEYLQLLENKFGIKARQSVESMLKIELKRKILGD